MPLKHLLYAVGTVLALAGPAATQEPVAVLPIVESQTLTLDQFKWINRPVVIFADTPADPRYEEQIRLLLERPGDLIERDVVVITDTDPAARSAIRLALRPRGFMLVVIGKDGTIVQRKPSPWSAREITRSIDKMPLRQEEIRERKEQALPG